MLNRIHLLLLPLLIMAQDSGVQSQDQQGFAVVELFTSEGCSSCPPADRLLSRIIDGAKPDQRIYCLSFHVDYWNYIGWKDPYSDKSYSDRQRQYSKAFRSSRIYTPQMIVNGNTEFVGSDESKARAAINTALRKGHAESLVIRSLNIEGEALKMTFDFNGSDRKYLLNLALVERGLVQQVSRGENSGRRLIHDNVVRRLKTTRITPVQNGKITMELSAAQDLEKCSVIAYVQSPQTMTVMAATEKRL